LYAAYRYDAEAGLYQTHWRWYNPATGQWTTEDPIGISAGDANFRRYVGNNGVNGVDPSGLDLDLVLEEQSPNFVGPPRTVYPVAKGTVQFVKEYDRIYNKISNQKYNVTVGVASIPVSVKDNWEKFGLAMAEEFAQSNVARYVYTKKYGFIDMKHFLTAFIKSQTYPLVPGSITREGVRAFGYKVELDQAKNGQFWSAFGFEDLPSNSLGIKFAEQYKSKYGNSTTDNLKDYILEFFDEELGGMAKVPYDSIASMNRIANFSDEPILNLKDPKLLTYKNTIYKPRSLQRADIDAAKNTIDLYSEAFKTKKTEEIHELKMLFPRQR